mmetsp:Transcript_51853/g.60599  ORF Transcript_51853/g.60599 Transcript_51853/m.60599 type:complete len:215 (+) Transcript_51853:685-1329(+)
MAGASTAPLATRGSLVMTAAPTANVVRIAVNVLGSSDPSSSITSLDNSTAWTLAASSGATAVVAVSVFIRLSESLLFNVKSTAVTLVFSLGFPPHIRLLVTISADDIGCKLRFFCNEFTLTGSFVSFIFLLDLPAGTPPHNRSEEITFGEENIFELMSFCKDVTDDDISSVDLDSSTVDDMELVISSSSILIKSLYDSSFDTGISLLSTSSIKF